MIPLTYEVFHDTSGIDRDDFSAEDSGQRVFNLFYRKFIEQLLHLFFGALTTLLNLYVFWVSAKFLPPLGANIIAWVADMIFAYMSNRI